MIAYKCTKCGSELESADDLAGQTDTCPDCGTSSPVPPRLSSPGRHAARGKE